MKIAFLWHYHQPPYKDPVTGEYRFPWVLYHALKNGYQMARLHEETGFPAAFNIVPCLIEQVADYAAGRANDPVEKALGSPPDKLSPRDVGLLEKLVGGRPFAGNAGLQETVLSTFFPPFTEFANMGMDGMLDLKSVILKGILPKYGQLAREGRIELFTSPYYHPLLPALCDLAEAASGTGLDVEFKHPEDAVTQLEKGRRLFRDTFGFAPRGLWPPEGAVSMTAARAAAEAGFEYGITDESVLHKSAVPDGGKADILGHYSAGGLDWFFRDLTLSNLLAFTYGSWPATQAVDDFIARVETRAAGAAEDSVLVIALDGENSWGGYRENAIPFLRELFERLMTRPGIQPVLFSEALKTSSSRGEINLAAGTWMGSFAKWIGHPEKNRTWEKLARARDLCGPSEDILAAEASDWFWWAGEPGEEAFGGMFDNYLRAARRRAGLKDD